MTQNKQQDPTKQIKIINFFYQFLLKNFFYLIKCFWESKIDLVDFVKLIEKEAARL